MIRSNFDQNGFNILNAQFETFIPSINPAPSTNAPKVYYTYCFHFWLYRCDALIFVWHWTKGTQREPNHFVLLQYRRAGIRRETEWERERKREKKHDFIFVWNHQFSLSFSEFCIVRFVVSGIGQCSYTVLSHPFFNSCVSILCLIWSFACSLESLFVTFVPIVQLNKWIASAHFCVDTRFMCILSQYKTTQ